MKRQIIFFLILWVGACGMESCKKDFLDLTPLQNLSDAQVWDNSSLTRLYVNNIYSSIESGITLTCDNFSATISTMTDDAMCRIPSSTGNTLLISGTYTISNAPLNNWNYEYGNIRKANLFFDKIKTSSLAEGTKKQLMGEVKFLRGLFYFELVKRFGGVPLITTAQNLGDTLLVSRNTLEECYEFIAKDLDDAASVLPETSEGGIANKWSAVALKSRVMLYAASYAQYGVMDPGGFAAISPGAAQHYWQAAYDAASEVIGKGGYQLVTNLNTLFIPKGGTPSTESIFEIQYDPPTKGNFYQYINGPGSEGPVWLMISDPSQQLVDQFPMQNGLPITNPASGYDPQHPFSGRDPRFEVSIFHHGSVWRDITTREPILINSNITPKSVTGYTIRKFMDPDITSSTLAYGLNGVTWVELRLGEIFLNYAEAAVELGKFDDALGAVKKLRDRAGVGTPFTVGVGRDSLLNIVRNERRIELCFENHRLWDIRRWRIADKILNDLVMTGMKVTDEGGNLEYEVVPADFIDPAVLPRAFYDKQYLFPIPFSEMQQNSNLKQNPGWE